jgi:hypothetical protein
LGVGGGEHARFDLAAGVAVIVAEHCAEGEGRGLLLLLDGRGRGGGRGVAGLGTGARMIQLRGGYGEELVERPDRVGLGVCSCWDGCA